MLLAFTMLLGGCDSSESRPESGRTTPAAPSADDETAIVNALDAIDRYLLAEDAHSARAIASRLVKQHPGDARAREMYARVLLSIGLPDHERGDPRARTTLLEAHEQYLAALELAPSAGLHTSAGSVAYMAGRPEAALEHYRQAERLEPLNPQPPLYAAQIQMQLGRDTEARAHLQRVLELDPDQPAAHASLARLWVHRDRFDLALPAILRARELELANTGFRVTEARIRLELGQASDALDLLLPLPADVRTTRQATEIIARAWTVTGRPDKAADAWAERYGSRRDEPGIHRSAIQAGWALLADGRPHEAASWLQLARLAAPDSPDAALLAESISNPAE